MEGGPSAAANPLDAPVSVEQSIFTALVPCTKGVSEPRPAYPSRSVLPFDGAPCAV